VSNSETICAGRFTAADISVGYALMFAQSNGLAAQFSPAISAYWSRLRERDGFRRAIASQDRAGIEQNVPVTS
jgi:glutathione S-transferase